MRRALLFCVLILVAIPATAQAAFHLEYAEEEPRTLTVRPLVPTSQVRATFARANDRYVEHQRQQRLAKASHVGGPSTNHRVDPWGCEADDAQDVSPSGKYWGKYQFDRQTWAAHGGNPGDYGSAPEAEQDRVASRVKYDAWPNC